MTIVGWLPRSPNVTTSRKRGYLLDRKGSPRCEVAQQKIRDGAVLKILMSRHAHAQLRQIFSPFRRRKPGTLCPCLNFRGRRKSELCCGGITNPGTQILSALRFFSSLYVTMQIVGLIVSKLFNTDEQNIRFCRFA